MSGVRAGGSSLVLLLCAVAILAIPASCEGAAEGPPLLLEFPSGKERASAAGSGRFDNPRGIAVDPSGRNVYIADGSNERVNVFSAWGEFRFSFGWGVADGKAEPQTCTSTCRAGLAGSGPGQLDGPRGVAVDEAGGIYVTDEYNHRVQKFDSEGNFVWMVGGGVNETSGANLCTAASGDACGYGTHGTGPGEFEFWDAGNFISVSPAGDVYVGDKGRIEVFDEEGRFKSQITTPERVNVGALAIDPQTGDLYYSYSQFLRSHPQVFKISAEGKPICTASVQGPTALAVGAGGAVFAVSDTPQFGSRRFEPVIVEMDSECRPVAKFGRPAIEGTILTSLASNEVGNLYGGAFHGTKSIGFVSLYGPPPSEIEPAPEGLEVESISNEGDPDDGGSEVPVFALVGFAVLAGIALLALRRRRA